jgi:photosystem II stability/assembly factor-like uncharacterized protein
MVRFDKALHALLRAGCAAFVLLGTAGSAGAKGDGLDPAHLESWKLPRASLYAVTAHGSNLLWACGYWGTILRSTDGGAHWSQPDSPTADTLYAISFADEKTGWAVGALGNILRSQDGGETWTRQSVDVADEMGGTRKLDVNLFGVAAISPTEAWAVGDLGTVLHTKDGSTWERIAFDAAVYADENIPERILNTVVFTSPTSGYIAGEFATLLRTEDGGATWVGARELSGAPADLYLFNLSAGGGGAAAVGLAGSVLVSDEGKATWVSRSIETTAGLFAIAWHGKHGVAAGDRGVIYVTNDGGASWTEPSRPKQLFNWLASATFVDDRQVVVVGEGGVILRSEDGGASWSATVASPAGSEAPIRNVGGDTAPKKPAKPE